MIPYRYARTPWGWRCSLSFHDHDVSAWGFTWKQATRRLQRVTTAAKVERRRRALLDTYGRDR